MTFANAIVEYNNPRGTTTNGARTNLSSLNACVDLFFLAGASRGKDISQQFTAAYQENPDIALRILLWLRDARGGAGERQQFRNLWKTLYSLDPYTAIAVHYKVPELGRWDDLLEAPGEVRPFALTYIAHALSQGDRLCAKWMPRKGPIAAELRQWLGITPKAYRKLIVGLSDTVEQKMCAKQWDSINFSHVPSVAAARYQKAFARNAADAYNAYKAALVNGAAKVNASAIFPHDVLLAHRNGDKTVAEQQWRSLPDYLGKDGGILPLIDLSGSMSCKLGGNPKSSTTCRDVAMALGLYIAERQTGAFHNTVFTFSSNSRAVVLNDAMTLAQKIHAVDDGFAGSTNVEAAFRKILEIAKDGNVRPEDMPKKLLILSDMEFNSAVQVGGEGTWGYGGSRVNDVRNDSALGMVRKAYAAAGYALPQIVFWNLNARPGNVPATVRDDGTALVSGYSPSILKAILAGDDMSPTSVMLQAVGSDRYSLDGVAAKAAA